MWPDWYRIKKYDIWWYHHLDIFSTCTLPQSSTINFVDNGKFSREVRCVRCWCRASMRWEAKWQVECSTQDGCTISYVMLISNDENAPKKQPKNMSSEPQEVDNMHTMCDVVIHNWNTCINSLRYHCRCCVFFPMTWGFLTSYSRDMTLTVDP